MTRILAAGNDGVRLLEHLHRHGAHCTSGPRVQALRQIMVQNYSNAKSEGINRVIKLVACAAFGFRNAANQHLRTRCLTTRRARGHLRTSQL
ncbi:transposase [Streptomyces sp. NPDC048430]|uniref:transposase n=1 Tax=Streptomyces sp. NPDC048430 TaxID=3155388 RepID=UPI003430A5CC